VRRLDFLKLIVLVGLLAAPLALRADSKNVEDELKPVKGNEKASDMRALKTELLVSKTESQAMGQLEKLLKKYTGTGMEAGLWQRKAELYLRMSKTERFFELSRDSETVVSAAPQRVKSASSKKYLSKAVETYDMIQRRFPNFDQLDVVIFNNAFTRQQLDQNKLAENLYRDLLNRFPNSELVPDTKHQHGLFNVRSGNVF
jgi:TolA-binding protein